MEKSRSSRRQSCRTHLWQLSPLYLMPAIWWWGRMEIEGVWGSIGWPGCVPSIPWQDIELLGLRGGFSAGKVQIQHDMAKKQSISSSTSRASYYNHSSIHDRGLAIVVRYLIVRHSFAIRNSSRFNCAQSAPDVDFETGVCFCRGNAFISVRSGIWRGGWAVRYHRQWTCHRALTSRPARTWTGSTVRLGRACRPIRCFSPLCSKPLEAACHHWSMVALHVWLTVGGAILLLLHSREDRGSHPKITQATIVKSAQGRDSESNMLYLSTTSTKNSRCSIYGL